MNESTSPPGSHRACRANVIRARGRVRITVSGDLVDRGEDRLRSRKLRRWVRQRERDTGKREGMTTIEHDRIKALEREVRDLRQANEGLCKASAYFAQAKLDLGFKP